MTESYLVAVLNDASECGLMQLGSAPVRARAVNSDRLRAAMGTKVAEERSLAGEASVPWRRIIWAGLRLNLIIGVFLILQQMLLGIREDVLIWAEVFGLSFLMSRRFVVQEAPSRFFWYGSMLGVMANVLRLVFIFLVPGISLFSVEFIVPGTQILLGCMAGALFARLYPPRLAQVKPRRG